MIEEIKDELRESGFYRKQNVKSRLKKSKAMYIKYELQDGSQVLVGRNNRENDLLTFKDSRPGDYWLHVKDFPGSHVLLRARAGAPSDEQILSAAGIAAYHSSLKDSLKASVDYMPVRYVKKPQGAKPGMVVFTRQKTVNTVPKIPDK